MKSILIFGLIVINSLSYGQTAMVDVSVIDASSNPIAHDKITFVGISGKKKFIGTTNEQGRFSVELPHNETYQIKIESLVDEVEYNTLNIPELPEGAEFEAAELQIMYEQPQSFTLSNLQFETGRSAILPKSFKELNHLAEYLKRKKDVNIKISGHTDDVGAVGSNVSLSQRRADAVRNYLITKGVNADRMESFGFGSDKPIATNTTPEGRAINRRTEIEIVKK